MVFESVRGSEVLTLPYAGAFLQLSIWELIAGASFISKLVLALLLVGSLLSWTIIFAKWSQFKSARLANSAFLRAFRKSPNLDAVAAAAEQFRKAPLAGVFDFGYQEAARQFKVRGEVFNKIALERTLQLGISEELTRLERQMSWLATTATVSPFVGLFGTVLGIIDSFQGLGAAGSASLRAVAPGISEALIATAAGLAAAIPAAIAYNAFGHSVRELNARMDDFSLEFLNLTERHDEE
ncbi:MAG: MotA/TolQ/ExbB proton channel family protein [Acidobacteria bacterium]|nr:MotA/TolQ/ExbB proton channel family protein [Acidobacteriota bacterium]